MLIDLLVKNIMVDIPQRVQIDEARHNDRVSHILRMLCLPLVALSHIEDSIPLIHHFTIFDDLMILPVKADDISSFDLRFHPCFSLLPFSFIPQNMLCDKNGWQPFSGKVSVSTVYRAGGQIAITFSVSFLYALHPPFPLASERGDILLVSVSLFPLLHTDPELCPMFCYRERC